MLVKFNFATISNCWKLLRVFNTKYNWKHLYGHEKTCV